MPGIVGLITKMPRERAEAELAQMLGAMHHESFYECGRSVDAGLGIYAGCVARKSDSSDPIPLSNELGNVFLLFSGEDFSEPGTKDRLKKQGHKFDEGGSSYLVHLAEEDANFPASLNGSFHGILINRTSGGAILFNDRFGMNKIYYHESKEAFYFAAEAKAILAVRPELARADLRGLGELVACGCVLENRTVFKDIFVLPSAAAWVFRAGSLERKESYFQPQEWERQGSLEPDAYYEELRDVLSRNLSRYFNGQGRVGISLTGGLDTRVIMAWRKPPAHSLPCYTFSGPFRHSQDVVIAQQVAGACRQSHEVITVGDEFLANFAHYAEHSVHLTEGSADVSRCSDLYVSQKAREIAPIKIVGTYGSEILQHAVMFKAVPPVTGLFHPEFLTYIRQAQETYAQLRQEHPVTFAAFRQSPWHHSGILALEQSQLTVRSPFLDNDFVRTVYRAPKSNGKVQDVRLRLISDGNPALMKIRSDRGVGGASGPITKASSRFLLEFLFKAEYAYDYGMPQWLARMDHLLHPLHFERLFLGRHKLLHYRLWYRDSLSGYVRQTLLDSTALSRPYVERKGVETLVKSHLKGERNYTTEIHKLLTLELLHRLFL